MPCAHKLSKARTCLPLLSCLHAHLLTYLTTHFLRFFLPSRLSAGLPSFLAWSLTVESILKHKPQRSGRTRKAKANPCLDELVAGDGGSILSWPVASCSDCIGSLGSDVGLGGDSGLKARMGRKWRFGITADCWTSRAPGVIRAKLRRHGNNDRN